MKALKSTLLIGTYVLIYSYTCSAQQKWSNPVPIAELSDKKIIAKFCTSSKDTLKYSIVSECEQLENTFVRFSLRYLDTLNKIQVQNIDELSADKPFKKTYAVPLKSGIYKIIEFCISGSVQAYCH